MTRIISGTAIFVILALLVLFCNVPGVVGSFFALIAALAVYEMLFVSSMKRFRLLLAILPLSSVAFLSISFVFKPDALLALLLYAAFLFLFLDLWYMAHYGKADAPDVVFVGVVTLFLSLCFDSAILIGTTFPQNRWSLLLVFLLAWIPDTGAYFVGCRFGKHKLAPVISPKKTIEGAVGGIISCLLILSIYCVLLHFIFDVAVVWYLIPVYGIFGTIISMIGDLTASLVKRHYGKKDYGRIIPGHGGVMDRFDSALLTAPFVWFLMTFIPLFK